MKASLLLLSLLSFGATAATLTIDPGLELQVLNGAKYEGDNSGIELNEGKNQLVIRVYDNFPKGSNEELFVSNPYVLTFDANDADLELSLSPKINDYRKVTKAFRKEMPEWQLLAGSTKTSFDSEPLPGREGLAPFSNLELLVADYNKSNGIMVTSGVGVEDLGDEVIVAVSESGDVELTGNALTQLKLWYSKASEEERKAFRKWIIDVE